MDNWLTRQIVKVRAFWVTFVLPDENTKNWKALKGKYKGQRAFLIGNGPSLNVTPLYLLRDEFTLAFNRFYMLEERINWSPKLFMCTDPVVLPDISNEINKITEKFELSVFLSIHKAYIQKRSNILWIHGIIPLWFSRFVPLTGKASTVAFQGLQVLNHLGFSEIYLIGVDQNYQIHTTAKVLKGREIESAKDDDPNHFDPRYFGKGRKYHQPDPKMSGEMIQCFEVAKKASEKLPFKVFNAGYNSNLEVFERKDFLQLFDYDQEKQLELFLKSFPTHFPKQYVLALLEKEPINTETTTGIEELESFVTEVTAGAKLAQKIVYTHLAFGPYQQKIVFISRKRIELSK